MSDIQHVQNAEGVPGRHHPAWLQGNRLRGLSVGLAILSASLIGGWLWDRISPAATFCFGAATATLSALLFIALIVSSKRSQRLTMGES